MADRIIPFPKKAVANQRPPISPNTQLLKAAKAAYSALLLAVPAGEKNTVIRALGQAIRAAERPEPPTTPSPAVKISEAAAAQLLSDKRSEQCFCGMGKKAGRPFCLRCYHSLPERIRASMFLSPLDSDQIFDAILEARAYLVRLGMLSADEALA